VLTFNFFQGGSLYSSLLQSQVDVSSTALHRMHLNGRVKAVVVHSLIHLLAAVEFIKSTIQDEKVLILFESLSAVFIAQKVYFLAVY
jgi:midasin (ATPase involved in ribosome maturation)